MAKSSPETSAIAASTIEKPVLHLDREFWALIEVTREVLLSAEKLAANHPFRTLDAIHVASAQLFAARLAASELTFVSTDARQTVVAASIGLPTTAIGILLGKCDSCKGREQ